MGQSVESNCPTTRQGAHEIGSGVRGRGQETGRIGCGERHGAGPGASPLDDERNDDRSFPGISALEIFPGPLFMLFSSSKVASGVNKVNLSAIGVAS